jgi:hypothetical protein
VPKIVIKVPLGETIQLKFGYVKFIEVLEDSRCPKEVTCVWEGRARVMVEVVETDKTTFQKELLFGAKLKGETVDNTILIAENIIIRGLDLLPPPISKVDEVREPFVLLIYIEELE